MNDSVITAISNLEAAGQALSNADSASDTAQKAVDAAQAKLDGAKATKVDADESDAFAADAYNAAVDATIKALADSKRIKSTPPAPEPVAVSVAVVE